MRFNAKTSEKIAFALLSLAALTVVGFVLIILGYIIYNGYNAISIEFLTEMPSNMMTQGGIYPAIVGTLLLIIGSMSIALPMGIMAAIYLKEYAENNLITWTIEMAISNLAGTPSVVFGLFGLALFVKYFGFGPSILSASLTLALLILPVIVRSSEEALLAVPNEYRESSLALGISKWQTIRHVVLPSAIPGMVTGSILSIGRVAGETAPILLTGAAYFLPKLPESIYSQFMALPYHLFVLATAGTNIAKTSPIQYGTALVLLIIVLILNTIAVLIRRHYRQKLKI
jgi:phosphate transport system permease protein